MGWPVSHSRSPRLHGYWLEAYGIDGAYLPLAVKPDRFAAALTSLQDLGFQGVNVTIPHKEAAYRAVDRFDDVARAVGAVNTIVFKDGSLAGSNTDVYGFLENLRQELAHWSAAAGPAVVLGAGGAARAVVVGLLQEGAPEIRLLNRTISRAEALATDMGDKVTVCPWGAWERAMVDAALLVNTTSLGMSGQPPLDLDLDPLPSNAVVNDLVYAPLETGLLASARRRGNRVVDGLGMLLHQARPGFEAWFGVAPAVTDDLRSFVLES